MMPTMGSPYRTRIAHVAETHLAQRLPDAPLDKTVAARLDVIEEEAGEYLPNPSRQAVGEALEALLIVARAERAGWPGKPTNN
jgi:hypothetical protein